MLSSTRCVRSSRKKMARVCGCSQPGCAQASVLSHTASRSRTSIGLSSIYDAYDGQSYFEWLSPRSSSLCPFGWGVPALSLTVGALLTTLTCAALGATGWAPLAKAVHYRKTLQSILLGFAMGSIGWLLARLHLYVFDRWFLHQGRLSVLCREKT